MRSIWSQVRKLTLDQPSQVNINKDISQSFYLSEEEAYNQTREFLEEEVPYEIDPALQPDEPNWLGLAFIWIMATIFLAFFIYLVKEACARRKKEENKKVNTSGVVNENSVHAMIRHPEIMQQNIDEGTIALGMAVGFSIDQNNHEVPLD